MEITLDSRINEKSIIEGRSSCHDCNNLGANRIKGAFKGHSVDAVILN